MKANRFNVGAGMVTLAAICAWLFAPVSAQVATPIVRPIFAPYDVMSAPLNAPRGIVRVSVASDGTQANADSIKPSLSSDGRFVVFESLATNLAPGGGNGAYQIFVHD